MKVTKSTLLPDGSIIGKGFGKIDYCDVFIMKVTNQETLDEITQKIFQPPKWVSNLMELRNVVVKSFGLKSSHKDESHNKNVVIGEKIGYFKVFDKNQNEIVMAEQDVHLNFKTSVMLEENIHGKYIFVSTIVQYNNFFGRLYFWIVRPFHVMVLKSMVAAIGEIKQ